MVKVIFLENVENNKVGDVKDVADGYARNFLFRNNFAVIATEEEMKKIEAKLDKIKKEEEKKVKEAEELKVKLESLSLSLSAMVGEENKLYGSITNTDISEALLKKGIEIDRHEIEFPETIKTTGEHLARIKLGHGVTAELKVVVKPAAQS